MEKQTYTVGERVEKFCATCGGERGHVVISITKSGKVSRVNCPKCGTNSAFKKNTSVLRQSSSAKNALPYDRSRTYRGGEVLMHPTFGQGEVTAVIAPQKIDVLFSDRMRRLIHAYTE